MQLEAYQPSEDNGAFLEDVKCMCVVLLIYILLLEYFSSTDLQTEKFSYRQKIFEKEKEGVYFFGC